MQIPFLPEDRVQNPPMFYPTVCYQVNLISVILLTIPSPSLLLFLTSSPSHDPFPFFSFFTSLLCLATGSLRIHPRERTEFFWHSFFPSVCFGDIMSSPSRIQASWERSQIPTFALILHQSSKGLVTLCWGKRQGKERSEAPDINTVQCVFIAA